MAAWGSGEAGSAPLRLTNGTFQKPCPSDIGNKIHDLHFNLARGDRVMMRFSKRFLCLAAGVVISAIFSSPSFAQNCDAPNPSVAISPPAASVSSNAAAFFGVWGGTWTFQGIRKTRADMCARLHVSVTSNNSANVSYCYGTRSDTGVGRQCDQYTASISGNVLQFKGNLGGNYVFTNQGGSLAAQVRLDASQRTTQTQFQKM